jgi:putative phosphoesterase
MKAAVIGDVHANLPALEAVLAHAEGEGVEAFWNVGDFVGYNAFPEQVVQRLRAVGAISVVGNYDLKVLKFPKKDEKWRRNKRPEKWRAFKWAYENLSEVSRAYLASLPREVRLDMGGRTVLLTHGSPASVSEHLYADTPEERLRELAALAEADVIVMGHSHRAFVREVNDVWFINTGSVGRQDDGDPRAGYAVLSLRGGAVGVVHHRIDYDVAAATAAIREAGLPREFEEMMRQGRKLDWILEQAGSG